MPPRSCRGATRHCNLVCIRGADAESCVTCNDRHLRRPFVGSWWQSALLGLMRGLLSPASAKHKSKRGQVTHIESKQASVTPRAELAGLCNKSSSGAVGCTVLAQVDLGCGSSQHLPVLLFTDNCCCSVQNTSRSCHQHAAPRSKGLNGCSQEPVSVPTPGSAGFIEMRASSAAVWGSAAAYEPAASAVSGRA
jgi:hypothetical protein